MFYFYLYHDFYIVSGEDLMHGARCPIDLQCLRNLTTDGHSAVYDKLFLIQKQLESHYRDMQVFFCIPMAFALIDDTNDDDSGH